jgi:hypothetical protein
MMGTSRISRFAMRAAAQLLRLVPGPTALRWKRDLRDTAWLAEADAIVVSYPKSGRTFVRAMLARVFQRRFGVDERRLLEFPMLRRARAGVPRLLFTHAGDAMRTPGEIRLNEASYGRVKVVLIARHPGDVAVSRFHHLRHRSRDKARQRLANQPLDTFVWDEQGGIPSIVKFLNDFAQMKRERGDVTIIRYEDFLERPRAALRQLTDAIGVDASDEDIADAVDFGAIRNLKKREEEGYFTSRRLRPSKAGDARSAKVRKGGSGGFRKNLGEREARHIDEYVKAELDPVFGY